MGDGPCWKLNGGPTAGSHEATIGRTCVNAPAGGAPSGSPHDQDPNSDHDNSAITESGSVWGICVEVGDWHTEWWTEESPIMQGCRAVGSSGMQDAGV